MCNRAFFKLGFIQFNAFLMELLNLKVFSHSLLRARALKPLEKPSLPVVLTALASTRAGMALRWLWRLNSSERV